MSLPRITPRNDEELDVIVIEKRGGDINPVLKPKQKDPFREIDSRAEDRVALYRVSHWDGGHHLEYNGQEVVWLFLLTGEISNTALLRCKGGNSAVIPLVCLDEYAWMRDAMRPGQPK